MSKPVVYALPRRLALFSKALGKGIIILLKCYQLLISPFLGSRCRFHPSCSSYAMDAIKTLGVLKGLYLTFKRLARCHPGHPGGIDQVPSS